MDGLTIATWVGSIGTVAAVAITIFISFRRRDFQSEDLRFWFGHRSSSLNRSSREKPISLYVVTSTKSEPVFPLVFQVLNKSKKSIQNVAIQLEFPSRFLLTDDALRSLFETGLGLRNVQINERLFSMRTVTVVSDMAIVRYNVGTLRAGEHFGSAELIAIPLVKRVYEADARFEGKPFSRIERLIRALKYVREHFVVQSFVYSDIPRKVSNFLSVAMLEGGGSILDQFASDYVRCHWFGRYPKPGSYLPISNLARIRGKKRLWKSELGELVTISGEDFLQPAWQSFMLWRMPGFDSYRLPPYVADPENALQFLGFVRVPRLGKMLLRRFRNGARRLARRTRERLGVIASAERRE